MTLTNGLTGINHNGVRAAVMRVFTEGGIGTEKLLPLNASKEKRQKSPSAHNGQELESSL